MQSKGISKVFSIITIWKHQFFYAQPLLLANSHICTWLLGKRKTNKQTKTKQNKTKQNIAVTTWIFLGKVMSAFQFFFSKLAIALFPRSKNLKFLHPALYPWLYSSVSYFIVYGNLKRICILLLCENCININYIELVHSVFHVYYILLLFCLFILLIFLRVW